MNALPIVFARGSRAGDGRALPQYRTARTWADRYRAEGVAGTADAAHGRITVRQEHRALWFHEPFSTCRLAHGDYLQSRR